MPTLINVHLTQVGSDVPALARRTGAALFKRFPRCADAARLAAH